MGVSLKTENEKRSGNASQTRGSEGRRRAFTGTCPEGFIRPVSRYPSARLTHGPKPATAVWLLRCSVLRETPMASAIHLKQLKCYKKDKNLLWWKGFSALCLCHSVPLSLKLSASPDSS